jgi:hypothetical protein
VKRRAVFATGALALVVVTTATVLIFSAKGSSDGETALPPSAPGLSSTRHRHTSESADASSHASTTTSGPSSRSTRTRSPIPGIPGRKTWPAGAFTVPPDAAPSPQSGAVPSPDRGSRTSEPTALSAGGTPSVSPSSAGGYIPGGDLTRYDPVPDGVAAQLDYFQGGGGDCAEPRPSFSIAIVGRPDLNYMAAPDVLEMCIFAYQSTGVITIEVHDPAGCLAERWTVDPQELISLGDSVAFRRINSDPEGMYSITATQGDLVASTTIDVRRARTPQFVGYVNEANGAPGFGFGQMIRPGETVRVAVGGFPPNTVVPLRIYGNPHVRESDMNAVIDYITSGLVTTDSLGGGIWEFKTKSTDPLNDCYRIFSEQVTRLMYPAPNSPEAPAIQWHVEFCVFP